ncbi:MAG TPA: glutathione S-transferase family protein [Burkholderiales bacterium]|nr:glutathione S-transferase family protein [Burkholderiales bacterium]
MKLYDAERSGNCHKIRLLLSLTGTPYERIAVDLKAGEQRTAAYRQLNPRGQVPVLDDGGTVIWDSTAILVYLARRLGREDLLPLDALGMAAVMQWLALAQNEILYGLARARAVLRFGRVADLAEAQAAGRAALAVLEERLAVHPWLALDRLTLADIACYPYAALAPEGDIGLEPYPAVSAWMERIAALPGHAPLPRPS